MIIEKLELYTLRIPLKKPFVTALRYVEQVEDLVVIVYTRQGTVGYGEAPPTAAITGDTLFSIAGAIKGHIAPAIMGLDTGNLEGVCRAIQGAIVGNTSAKAAVEIAIYDLWAKEMGAPLSSLLGGAKKEMVTDYTISLGKEREMVEAAIAAWQSGFHRLKVKVGRGDLGDVKTLLAIRRELPEAAILVDANQGWEEKQALGLIRQMEDGGLNAELIEQPLPAHDLEGMRRITRLVDTPILADESVFSPRQAMEIIRLRAADMINIKLMKTGGIWAALQICAMAEAAGIPCMMGCMLEGPVSVTAAVHLALAKGIVSLADLDGPVLIAQNPVEGGAVFTNERMQVTDAPGLGIIKIDGLEPYKQ